MEKKAALPIESILPDIQAALSMGNRLIITAAPGSGKTTRIPLALLEAGWLQGRRIVMLEPRRVAAKSAASYMAGLLGEKAGATVGYRMRYETKISAATRIEIMTEGVLTRRLQQDQALEDVGLVIFDEFHERSVHADLGLSLCLEVQELLRPDLRILVMSATLATEQVVKFLGNAPVLSSGGACFPVATIYLEKRLDDWLNGLISIIKKALSEETGDILAFLPGAGEIRRTTDKLRQSVSTDIVIAPLYGALPLTEQEAALRPLVKGRRKVVLATSIAETSLTVEGVTVVVDGGLMRVPRFSARSGLTRLETVQVSLATADQRRGRAGRLSPGVCYRLWTKQEEIYFKPQNTPEILETDLLPLALELAAWGIQECSELSWLDCPSELAFSEAKSFLKVLGALDDKGRITDEGREMAALGLQPRLAHMLLAAQKQGQGLLACDAAALLGEKDILGARTADFRLRLEILEKCRKSESFLNSCADSAAVRRILFTSRQYQQILGIQGEAYEVEECGQVLALAYGDRIAKFKGAGSFLLRSGRGARLPVEDSLNGSSYLAVAELDDKGAESRIFLAAPVSETDIRQCFATQIEKKHAVWWDKDSQMVRALCCEQLGEILLKEVPFSEPPNVAVTAALLEGIKLAGLTILPWTKADRQLQQRITFLHELDASWPDVCDENLLASLSEWLAPYVQGMKRRADLQQLSMGTILLGLLSWPQHQQLLEYAPTHILVPSGQRIPIDYREPEKPVLAVRLQELFGLTETPRIAGGKIPLTLHLLSPAHRPVQVTQDLCGFWANSYFMVKKELAGRYPKHYWPDNPLEAPPTHRTKPRK